MADTSLKILSNCDIGGCTARNIQSTCPECVHWTPTRGSKYRNCNRWWTSRLTCDLPRSACASCEFHIPKGTIPPGRPNETGVDWTDPEAVKAYYRRAQKERRESKDATSPGLESH